jgi:hemerythrin-like domain-containing protein
LASIETLRKAHDEILKRLHLVEQVSLRFLEEKAQLSREEYTNYVNEFSQFFKTSIMYHFKVEEQALFPILKSKGEASAIEKLLSDHRRILTGFQYFENMKDPEASTKLLRNLINDLSAHARKEEELFPLWARRLSGEELKRIDEEAKLVGL